MAEASGDLPGICISYANLAGNCIKLDEFDECLEYGEKGLEIARSTGLKNSEAVLLVNIASVNHRREDHGATAVALAQASKLMDFDGGAKEQIHFASVLSEICSTLNLQTEAAEMVGAVIAMRKDLQIGNREGRGDAEDELLASLDLANNPLYAAAMERGAALDRAGLVNRIQELSAEITAIRPPASGTTTVAEQKPSYNLTPREIEVMQMVAKGLTNTEIADDMFVSARTVTTHLSNIFGKLDVGNRSRAIAAVTEAGLV